jgi:hypothetical protein
MFFMFSQHCSQRLEVMGRMRGRGGEFGWDCNVTCELDKREMRLIP